MNTAKITVENPINVETNKVWDYYNQPEHIVNWNFANADWYCPKATNDFRVGGKLATRMEAKDGSFGFDFEGVYDEIIRQKKISYILEDGRKVSITFEDLGDKTKISISFDTDSENSVEMQRAGWQAILYNFKKYSEGN
ncbi:SRPBCC family protein [Aequorivita capsosiphonis]|uniref:SRPBCC family protein n=1 Tax=Aequorivita capsosiphonis TaxID=487317 RepID=UPI0004119F00|nr:SRPBCC family protein [Aequorivita capsosiphonis]